MPAVETFVAGDGERGVRKGGTCVASTGCGYGWNWARVDFLNGSGLVGYRLCTCWICMMFVMGSHIWIFVHCSYSCSPWMKLYVGCVSRLLLHLKICSNFNFT